MTAGDRSKFTSLISALAATFRVEASPALFEGYWLGLSRLSIEDVGRAVVTAISTSRYMPVVVELRRLAGAHHDPAVCAAAAWEAVKKSIATHGAYASVDFGPLINATIRNLGGWSRFCNEAPEESDKWLRKDFERLYLAFLDNGIAADSGRHLPGIHESSSEGLFRVAHVLAPLQPSRESIRLISGPTPPVGSQGARSGEPVVLGELLAAGVPR